MLRFLQWQSWYLNRQAAGTTGANISLPLHQQLLMDEVLSLSWFTFTFSLLAIYLLRQNIQRWSERRRLPPGPKRLPLVGNAFDIPAHYPQYVFDSWSKTHGKDRMCRITAQPIDTSAHRRSNLHGSARQPQHHNKLTQGSERPAGKTQWDILKSAALCEASRVVSTIACRRKPIARGDI